MTDDVMTYLEQIRTYGFGPRSTVPPLTSQIIGWLEADEHNTIEWWSCGLGKWVADVRSISIRRRQLTKYGDQRQYGYRLAIRKAATERVRLDQIIGRTLPGDASPVVNVWCGERGQWLVTVRCSAADPRALDVAEDGTVEVLKADR